MFKFFNKDSLDELVVTVVLIVSASLLASFNTDKSEVLSLANNMVTAGVAIYRGHNIASNKRPPED